MPSGRDSFRRNRVAPIHPILSLTVKPPAMNTRGGGSVSNLGNVRRLRGCGYGQAALEVSPGSPDWSAHVAYISGLAEQFSDPVEHLFQHGEPQNVGNHSRRVALSAIWGQRVACLRAIAQPNGRRSVYPVQHPEPGLPKVTSGHKGTVRRLTPGVLPSRITKREISGENMPKTGPPQESSAPSAVEQAVSRALRDNLERIQRSSDELQQAVGDVVAACASSKPVNALPPMLRAQTSAASLAAALEVLSRFVAVSLQPGPRSPFEAEIARIASTVAAAEPVAAPAPAARPAPAPPAPQFTKEPVPAAPEPSEPPIPEAFEEEIAAPVAEPELEGEFNVSRLSPEEQELHRRANRVAKVSMQDIKMLHPEQVRLGREKKDICNRLRDDIEKAHREYDRRFKPIMDHPVDYFYRWMVEILAEGDPHALGEYPYTPATRQH